MARISINRWSQVARLLSNLLSPLFLPVIVYGYATTRLETNSVNQLMVMAVVVVFFSLIPLIILLVMKQQRKIDTIDIRERASRNRPYMYALMCMTSGLLLFRLLPIPNEHIYAVLAIIPLINGMIAAMINLRWKISIHAMGMASSAVALYYLSGPAVLGWPPIHTQSLLLGLTLVILTALVQWARVRLDYHTIPQVLAGGFFAGFSTAIQLEYLLPKTIFAIIT